MDYIREKLLQQEDALAAFMTGSMLQDERKEKSRITNVEQENEMGRKSEPTYGEKFGFENEVVRSVETENEYFTDRQMGSTDVTTWKNTPAEKRIAETIHSQDNGPRSIITHMEQQPAFSAHRGAFAEHVRGAAEHGGIALPYVSFEKEDTESARGMSRAIQRDARRYDGGFSIY